MAAAPARQHRRPGIARWLPATAALLGAAFFLWNTVRPAWTTDSSDFPNYYTAARLLEEHQPLSHFYEWPWFQRQIVRIGFGTQLGGYVPQTPLTMLPFLPVASLPPLAARRVWLIFNLAFLAVALHLISRITHFRFSAVWLIALCSYPALRSNILLGQYYLLLLAMFSAVAFCLARGWNAAAGVLAGCSAALKLYGAPFLLFFAAVRRNHAVRAMLLAILAAAFLAVLLFGWRDVEFFGRIILPRALSGETLDPYNPGNGSGATLFRRLLIAEPELNPHPLLDSPALFTFIWAAFASSAIAIPALATAGTPVAWWIIATLLASANTASYTFALLPLCAALLLRAAPRRHWPFILATNVLIALPLWAAWRFLFPRFWLLLVAFLAVGWPYMKRVPIPRYFAAALGILTLSTVAALRNGRPNPPGGPAIVQHGAIYSGRAAPSTNAIFFESIGDERYELRIAQESSIRVLQFPGHAFHPSVPDSGSPVYFDLSGLAGDRLMWSEPGAIPPIPANPVDFAVSHSGDSLAVASNSALFVASRQVTTSDHPHDLAFTADDQNLIFVAGPNGNARLEQLALATGRITVLARTSGSFARPSLSSDGALFAYASRMPGHNWIIQLERRSDHAIAAIAAPGCNCYDPAWEPASDEIIYSTDCRRGVLLPRLMRVRAASLFHHPDQ